MSSLRHYIQYGLLLFASSLIATGALAYFYPFSIVVARIHIASGIAVVLLLGVHVVQKRNYFKRFYSVRNVVIAIACFWSLIIIAVVQEMPGSEVITDLSYEHHQKRAIFRPPLSAATFEQRGLLQTTRLDHKHDALALSLTMRLNNRLEHKPAIAIWAESNAGAMIETLYLSPELAFSDRPYWYDEEIARHRILPIWRNRFSLKSGLDIDGSIDAETGATENHQFSLDSYLEAADEYLIYLEINAPFDTDSNWADPLLGQPSVLYSVYMEHEDDRKYVLMELTGHGGEKNYGGNIEYKLDDLSSAKKIIEFVLVSVEGITESN